MDAGDDIRNDLAGWSNNSDSNLAEAHVDFAYQKRREGVAGEGAEEHTGHYCVVYFVVFLNLAPFVSSFFRSDKGVGQRVLHMGVKPRLGVSIKYI